MLKDKGRGKSILPFQGRQDKNNRLKLQKTPYISQERKDINLLAVELWTLQQDEAVVSFPVFRAATRQL